MERALGFDVVDEPATPRDQVGVFDAAGLCSELHGLLGRTGAR
jgi:hypothetical protein